VVATSGKTQSQIAIDYHTNDITTGDPIQVSLRFKGGRVEHIMSKRNYSLFSYSLINIEHMLDIDRF
jgi:hypothetical protein